jgi:soluble lytic murein transglycosylase-like protein
LNKTSPAISGPAKIAFAGLILGCSAIALAIAVPSEPFHFKASALEPPAVRSAFATIRLELPHIISGRFSSFMSFIGPRRPAPLGASEILELIAAAARKHNVSAAFVKSIMAAESGFNSEALSPKGAVGLMQLMPATAKQYGANPGLPDQNVDAGTHYLRVLMDRYRRFRNPLPRVIAAYNAGPGMVDRYRGVPPFQETRRYVVRVLGFLHTFGS